MTFKVPQFKEPGLTDFLTRLVEERVRGDDSKLSKVTANHSILLQSPGNKVFEITVSDTGTLTATQVA